MRQYFTVNSTQCIVYKTILYSKTYTVHIVYEIILYSAVRQCSLRRPPLPQRPQECQAALPAANLHSVLLLQCTSGCCTAPCGTWSACISPFCQAVFLGPAKQYFSAEALQQHCRERPQGMSGLGRREAPPPATNAGPDALCKQEMKMHKNAKR